MPAEAKRWPAARRQGLTVSPATIQFVDLPRTAQEFHRAGSVSVRLRLRLPAPVGMGRRLGWHVPEPAPKVVREDQCG